MKIDHHCEYVCGDLECWLVNTPSRGRDVNFVRYSRNVVPIMARNGQTHPKYLTGEVMSHM